MEFFFFFKYISLIKIFTRSYLYLKRGEIKKKVKNYTNFHTYIIELNLYVN